MDTTEIYTSAGWIRVNLDALVLSDHVCMGRGCGQPAERLANQGLTERREPILWAVCGGCAEEIGAENHHADFMAEHE